MPKLLPRSSSTKSGGDEEEGEEAGVLEANAQTSETGGDSAGETTAESGMDAPGDAQQEEPVPSSSKSDNQTIMRFLGDKEKVSFIFFNTS